MVLPLTAHQPGPITRSDPTRRAPLAPTIPDHYDAIARRGNSRSDFIARACDFLTAYFALHPDAHSASVAFDGETIHLRADDLRFRGLQ